MKSSTPSPCSGTVWKTTGFTACSIDLTCDVRIRPASARRNPGGSSMVKDAMALKRIDHVRMFVGNARQSAYFYRNAFGFEVIAYAGLETGVRHEACYVLRQGDITFVLASPLRGDHPDAQRLVRHGDGVQSIALEVDDVTAAFEAALSRGAQAGRRRLARSRTSSGPTKSPRSMPMATRRTRW